MLKFLDRVSTTFWLSASISSIRATPVTVLSVVFRSLVTTVALSPSLTNRGMLGCTMTLLLATASASMVPAFISRSCASASNRHVVTLSGSVKLSSTLPLASVLRSGAKKAVSSKFSLSLLSV